MTHRPLWALSRGAYDQTLNNILTTLSPLPDVQGIFTFGEVSDPGISDLDLVVVVSDTAAVSTLLAVQAAARADRVTRYVFSFHPPEVIPRRSLQDIAYFPSLYKLRQVWGEPIEIIVPPEEERLFPRLADYVDFTFAVGVLWRRLAEGRPHLRSFLYLLKVYAHSLRMADLVLARPPDNRIADRVRAVRQESLAGREDMIASVFALFGECIQALRAADQQLEAFLQRHGVMSLASFRETVPYPDGRFYVFETPVGKRSAVARGLVRQRRWQLPQIDSALHVYPGFYLAQFATYGRGTGAYGRAHRIVFEDRAADLIIDSNYRQVLTSRVRAVERVYAVTRRGGLLPWVPLGIAFRAPDSIRVSWIQRLLRPIMAARAAGRLRWKP